MLVACGMLLNRRPLQRLQDSDVVAMVVHFQAGSDIISSAAIWTLAGLLWPTESSRIFQDP